MNIWNFQYLINHDLEQIGRYEVVRRGGSPDEICWQFPNDKQIVEAILKVFRISFGRSSTVMIVINRSTRTNLYVEQALISAYLVMNGPVYCSTPVNESNISSMELES